ncbi:ABC transporter ATP-binding protein [Flavobacterium columnare]|uniref:ABC transporter ATP-binding protein n=2 Tax=Flavobacterium TaxID=237 RepID=A0ABW8PSL4_9FLAO|nr:ABC transporter ATP-binding protein [Flavobacterium columnare]SPE78580.1 putative multidrug resistance ABC transporter ATP-binding/permease protein YheI [Flavobacterium columnare]
MKELRYINPYFIKYKYHFFGGILITIIAQFFSLYTPELIGDSITKIEEYFRHNQSNSIEIKENLKKYIILILGATLFAGFLTFLMRQTLIVMSRHVEYDIKNEVFKKYEILSQSFYTENRTGDLMNRITEDIARVRMYVGPAVMYTINTIIRFAIVIFYMIKISKILTLVVLLPLPILAYSIFKISSEINKKSTVFQQNLSKLTSFIQEYFSGIRVVKSYHTLFFKELELHDFSHINYEKSIDLAKTQAFFAPLMLLLIGLSNLFVISVGGYLYIQGDLLNLGVIAKFILYINMLIWPVTSIGWVSSLVQEAEASQKRINEFLKIEPDILDNLTINTPVLANKIDFKEVSFGYPNTKELVLKNITFTIKKGEKVVILGSTGSGKTSLLSLIPRLYDVSKGAIFIDGINIKEIRLKKLRDAISVVPQDSFLFSDTIYNNICFGKENATLDNVISVAKQAVIHDNIEGFKEKYQTLLGERGITLSGGQKQRVSIARALIKEASVILLDDSLSAIDTETEEKILNNLDKKTENQTIIMATHRVSSAKHADRIIVLENGLITQQGTHNQLVNKEGYYRNLYLKQLTEKDF